MGDDTIPLFEGEPTGAGIIHLATGLDGEPPPALRCRRMGPRRPCEHVLICFSPRLLSGRIDQAECPVLNISMRGIAIEYDQKLLRGTAGNVDYRTISGRTVHVGCTVRRCRSREDGRFIIGLELHRKLQFDECKPARQALGREVGPGIRARKLQATRETCPPSIDAMDSRL